MSYYEYVAIPAPKDAPRAKGVKGTGARLAHGLSEMLNRYGAEGWEFQRTETLGVETKPGFFSRPRIEQVTVMIFRRWIETSARGVAHLPQVAAERYEEWRETAPTPGTPVSVQDTPEARPAQPLTASRRSEGNLHPLSRPGRA